MTLLPATAIGSLPNSLATRERGIDPRLTAAFTRETFAQFPYLVELPQRGPGADMIGRTAVLLAQVSADFAVSSVPTGWRRTSGPGVDLERAAAWWQQDMDALAEVYDDYEGPLKLQLCGPITVSRFTEDAAGEPALRDRGFVNDVAAALAEAAGNHIARVSRLLPKITPVLQIDEPALHDAVRGTVPTASGYARVRPLPEAEVAELIGALAKSLRTRVNPEDSMMSVQLWLHDCGVSPSLAFAVSKGFDAVSIDLTTLRAHDIDACGAAIDAGRRLVLGVLSPDDWELPETRLRTLALSRSEQLRSRLSISERDWAHHVTLSPACGLAGASATQARSVLRAISSAGSSVAGDTITVNR